MQFWCFFWVKIVAIYALSVCKIFGPKIRLVNFLTNLKSPQIRPYWRFISNHSRYNPIGPQFNSIRENCVQINLNPNQIFSLKVHIKIVNEKDWTRSSWLNCALRGDEAVYWVSIGQQWLVGTWWYWVSMRRWGHWYLTHSLRDFER